MLRYLDQLGMASKFNTKVYCRQSLVGGNYGLLNSTTFLPNPDYYRQVPSSVHSFLLKKSIFFIKKCFFFKFVNEQDLFVWIECEIHMVGCFFKISARFCGIDSWGKVFLLWMEIRHRSCAATRIVRKEK